MSKEQATAANVLVIEIVNQQPSNFFLDGAQSDDADLPSVISAPNARKIKNTTKIKYVDNDGKEKLKKLRYIKGCDEIEVDKQVAAGYAPNPSQDSIWVLNGKLTVVESGSDIGLYLFLKAHENNVSNPDRPDNAVDIFTEIDTSLDALKIESLFDEETKILKYLSTLKRDNGNFTEYNHDALEFLCSLFKLPAYDKNSPSEAWVDVAMFAKANPKKFFNGLANAKSMIESEVRQALEIGVISIDDTKAFFDDGKKTIIGFKSTQSTDDKVIALIDYMANPKHRTSYDHLRSALHQKKINASKVVL